MLFLFLWYRLRELNSKPQLSVLPYTRTILGKGKLLERPELYTVPTGNRGGTPTHALFALFYSTYSAPWWQTLETPQTRRSNARSRAAQFALSEEAQTPTVSRKPSTTPILAGLKPAVTSADSSLADYLNSSASESDHRRGLSGGGMICTYDL